MIENIKDFFENYDSYEAVASAMTCDEVSQLNNRIFEYFVNEEFSVTEELVKNLNRYLEPMSGESKYKFLKEVRVKFVKIGKTSISTLLTEVLKNENISQQIRDFVKETVFPNK